MEQLNLVQLKGVPILKQLQWEEALLRADEQNWCLINEGSLPAIVMGISGKPTEQINTQRLLQAPIPVIRRFSGGGTVVVDENTLFITFICNHSSVSIPPFPPSIMKWTARFYEPLFHPHPFLLRENDYAIGHRKFGGNAQAINKTRWLHHSSLLWDFSLENMDYLLLPPRMPVYREKRSHAEFLCRLKDYWPSLQSFKASLLNQLSCHFALEEKEASELDKVACLTHRQSTILLSSL